MTIKIIQKRIIKLREGHTTPLSHYELEVLEDILIIIKGGKENEIQHKMD